MGYELMGKTERSCPCGESIVVMSNYMDDWNRTKTTAEMICGDCKEKYVQHGDSWVRKEDWQLKVKTEQEYNDKKLLVDKMAATQLADEWYRHFHHIRTKKALYTEIAQDWDTGLGVDGYYRSFISRTKFNEAMVGKSTEEAIRHSLDLLLRYTNAYQVMDKLSSTNEKVTAELAVLDRLYSEKTTAAQKMNKHLR